MMRLCNPNMGMGMDIVHAVMNVHVYINVYQEFLSYSNVHHLGRLLKNLLLLCLLGGHMSLGFTWWMGAVGYQCGSVMVLYWQAKESHLYGCLHLWRN